MTAEFVMTENALMKRKPISISLVMRSYTIYSYNVQCYVAEEEYVHKEGDIGVGLLQTYEIR